MLFTMLKCFFFFFFLGQIRIIQLYLWIIKTKTKKHPLYFSGIKLYSGFNCVELMLSRLNIEKYVQSGNPQTHHMVGSEQCIIGTPAWIEWLNVLDKHLFCIL